MPQSTFSVRMDETLKNEFEVLCNDFGMNMTTAITIFAKAVVRERKIPFEISSTEKIITRDSALKAFNAIREKSAIDFPYEMSLKEINKEIEKVRNGEEDN